MTPARPSVVSQAEWDAALANVTEREEAVAAAMDELAATRKRMPMVRVEHDYRFEGPDGQRSLPELFDGRNQLILYEDAPEGWPQAPFSFWYRRHDEFDDDPPPSATGGDPDDRS